MDALGEAIETGSSGLLAGLANAMIPEDLDYHFISRQN